MTDLNKLTKPALNDMLAKPLTASALKKIAKADLVAMFDTQKPKTRKPRELPDRVMVEPGKPEDVKATKAGSKRHLMAEALAKGATIDELTELLGWNKDTVTSAFRADMRALGFGVERKAGKYRLLLPKGMKRIPAHDADTTRADALVAACK